MDFIGSMVQNIDNNSSSSDDDNMARYICYMQLVEGETSRIPREPCRTSILTGSKWVDELLNGHPNRIWQSLHIGKRPFMMLCNLLVERGIWKPKKQQRVDVKESLAIFLYAVSRNVSQTDLAERFQRSTATTDWHVKIMGRALHSLAPEIIRPGNTIDVHPKILNNGHYYPWFQVSNP